MALTLEQETALLALLDVTNKTISELEASPALTSDMLLPVENGAGTFATSIGDVKDYTEERISDITSTATAAGTTTLTAASNPTQIFTGVTTQNVDAPVVSTLYLGKKIKIVNKSTGIVTARTSGGNTIQAMASGTQLELICISLSGTGTASWVWLYSVLIPVPPFESAQQTITSAGSLTLAHGLGGIPKRYKAFLVCQTGEHGWTAGDETEMLSLDGSGTAGYSCAIVPDATNLNIRFGDGGVVVLNKSNGAEAVITNGNWKAVFRASLTY